MANNHQKAIILELLGRPVAYITQIAKATKSVKLGILWSQLNYWSDKTRDAEGWIYKTQAELYDETGMSRKEQETARRHGRKIGIIEEKLAGQPATVHFKINYERTVEVIEKYLEDKIKGQIPLFDFKPKGKKPKPKIQNVKSGFETFWKAYPKKVAKGVAEASWERLEKKLLDKGISINALFENEILKDIEARKKTVEWLNEKGQFIPHPSTYINQKRWEDEDKGQLPKEQKKKPFYRGDPMVLSNGKYFVIINGEWKTFAGKESDIEWRIPKPL